MKKLSIFLGGTCSGSTWREELLKKLNGDTIDAFNPVVPDWTPECQKEEDYHKENDDINLFVITPEANSPYSLFEIGVEASVHPERTVVCFLDNQNGTHFSSQQAKAYAKIAKDLKGKVAVYDNLDDLAADLNRATEIKKSKEEDMAL